MNELVLVLQDLEKHRETASEYLKYFESTVLPSKTTDAPRGTRVQRVEVLMPSFTTDAPGLVCRSDVMFYESLQMLKGCTALVAIMRYAASQ